MEHDNSISWLDSLPRDGLEDLKLDFATAIDTAINLSGLRRKDVAHAIGTSPAWITKVLRGDANPTLETMHKLADASGHRVFVHVVPLHVKNVVWSEVCDSRKPPSTSVPRHMFAINVSNSSAQYLPPVASALTAAEVSDDDARSISRESRVLSNANIQRIFATAG